MNNKDRVSPEDNGHFTEAQSQEQKLQTMISALWERSRHTVVERAALLRTAGDLLSDNGLDQATQQKAVDSAHKLAGVLGTFGLPTGYRPGSGGGSAVWSIHATWQGRDRTAAAPVGRVDPSDRPRARWSGLKVSTESRRLKQPPGLKPRGLFRSVSAGLKTRFPGLKSGAGTTISPYPWQPPGLKAPQGVARMKP